MSQEPNEIQGLPLTTVLTSENKNRSHLVSIVAMFGQHYYPPDVQQGQAVYQ